MAKKKRVQAGALGNSKYYYDDKGNVVDENGKPVSKSIADAFARDAAVTAPVQSTSGPALPVIERQPDQQPVGSALGSAASSIAASIKSSSFRSTSRSSFNPRNIIRGVSNTADISTAVEGGSLSAERSILQAHTDILQAILDATRQNGKASIDGFNELIKVWGGNQIADIEARRESTNAVQLGEPTSRGQTSRAGGLSGIFGGLNLGGMSGILGNLISVFKLLGRLAGPIALLASLSLKAQDFDKLAANFAQVFGDFLDGNIFEGITRAFLSIGDLVVKGLGRLTANVLNFFGAKETAEKVNKFLDEFNLADYTKAVTDFLSKTTEKVLTFLGILESETDKQIAAARNKIQAGKAQEVAQEVAKAQEAGDIAVKETFLKGAGVSTLEEMDMMSPVAKRAITNRTFGQLLSMEGKYAPDDPNSKIAANIAGLDRQLRKTLDFSQLQQIRSMPYAEGAARAAEILARGGRFEAAPPTTAPAAPPAPAAAPMTDEEANGLIPGFGVPKTAGRRLPTIDRPSSSANPTVNITGGTTVNNVTNGAGVGNGRNSGAVNTTAPQTPLDQVIYGQYFP